jgi:hypothetical protein
MIWQLSKQSLPYGRGSDPSRDREGAIGALEPLCPL